MQNLTLPVLPLRDLVVFPNMVAPLFVGRKSSINALNHVMIKDKRILIITQKDPEVDDPSSKDLYKYGTVCKILQLLKLPDGTIKVLVEGVERANVLQIHHSNNYLSAKFSSLKIDTKTSSKIKALTKY